MKTYQDNRRVPLILTLFVLACCLLAGCGSREEAITSTEQLNEAGRRIGVGSDTAEDRLVAQELPLAQVEYFSDAVAGYTSVSQGKLDAFVYGKLAMTAAIQNGMHGVRLLDTSLGEGNTIAVALSPKTEIPELEDRINAFLDELRADGTLDDMVERWIVRGDETMPNIPLPETSELHLAVGTTGVYEPFTYYIGTELGGYDIELAYRFAAWLGATLEFKVYDYDGIVAGAQGGDVDCIFAGLFVTPERAEALHFSQPTYVEEIGVMVRDTGAACESVDDLAGARIGVVTGTIHDSLVEQRLPTARIVYFSEPSDLLAALKAGRIDAFVRSETNAVFMRYEDDDITWLDEHLLDTDVGFIFAKTEEGRALNERFSDYIRALREDGGLDALVEKWFGEDESVKTLADYTALPATNGTLRMATTGVLMPFAYIRDNTVVGFEVELAARFCEENGCCLQVEQMNFDGILASVQTGKCDFAGSCLAITEERKESVDFSEPHYAESVVFVVLGGDEAEKGASFLDGVRESFQKTFIRESRWKLFLEGIGTTLLITVLSILFGTVLGFVVFMLCRNGNPAANAVTRFCVWLVQGMPVVVLLMILYYIIFGKVAISGTAVSVVGFTLIFGAAVYAMLKSGVGAIDRGQTEAAYALGYTDRKAFYRVVLPQALPHFMPAYKGEITALIKATAVVGYVAVQDLTKMGDIVRSRTYEAFFPLIAVAVIYFILAAILTFIVNRIEIRIDPRRRSREDILKGVDVQ